MSTLINTGTTNPDVGSAGPGYATALRAIAAILDGLSPVSPVSRGANGTGGNDTVGLQDAVNDAAAAEAAAGGSPVVKIRGSGTHLTGKLLMPTTGKIVIEGDGSGISKVQLRPGAESALIETNGYDDLVAANSTGGNVDLQLRGVTLLGDKANQTTPVDLVRLYGRRIRGADVEIGDALGRGLSLAWASALGSPDGRGMECRLSDFDIYGCDGGGALLNAHDMRWMGGNVSECGGIAIEVGEEGHGTQLTNVHAWGLPNEIGYVLRGSGVMMRGCQGEGASIMQVLVLANDADIDGRFYQPVGLEDTGMGIVLGQGGEEVITAAATRIHARLQGFHNGALDFGGDAGLTDLDVVIYQTDGVEFADGSTPHAESYGRIHMAGRAGAANYFHQKGRWQVPEGMDVNGNVAITSDDWNLILRGVAPNQRTRIQFENPDETPIYALIVQEGGAPDDRLVVYYGGAFGGSSPGVALRALPSKVVELPSTP